MSDRGDVKLKRYLGDGVYAGFDGYLMWLWTDRFGSEHEIAIDANTYFQLHSYWIDLADIIARKESLEREEI
jgi:hypothetical protein